MNGRFTIAEDEMLIELVKTNPLVYHVTSKTYANIQNRNQIWKEIAKQLNRSGKSKFLDKQVVDFI